MTKSFALFSTIWFSLIVCSCAKTMHSSNGESIYKSGKNMTGKSLFDRQHSQLRIIKSCKGCHGASGKGVRNCNISWAYLTNSSVKEIPYTRELFFRFLDEDLKSDGSKARTGVHWNMSDEEKQDLIEYLKTLK